MISLYRSLFVLFFSMSLLAHETTILYLMPTKTGGWSLRQDFMLTLTRLFHADVFIESGTSYADTAKIARTLFKEIHTVELDEKLYARARELFYDESKVHVYLGSSADAFPAMLAHVKKRSIIFWLDGHFSGGTTACADSNTPILSELEAIKAAGIIDAIILIDDIGCFHPDMKQIPDVARDYPTVQELKNAVLRINPAYEFIVYGDIAIAYPPHYTIVPSPLVRAMTTSRLWDKHTDQLSDLFQAEAIIASQTTPAELEALWNMCTYNFGWHRSYPYLWYSLALFTAGRYAEAYDNFSIVLDSGYDHWRVSWYGAQAAYRAGKDYKKYTAALSSLTFDAQATTLFLAMLR